MEKKSINEKLAGGKKKTIGLHQCIKQKFSITEIMKSAIGIPMRKSSVY